MNRLIRIAALAVSLSLPALGQQYFEYPVIGPTIKQVQTLDLPTYAGTASVPITTTAGNTLVVFTIGNLNGGALPVPTATGVTFTECTPSAATTGDRFTAHFYYMLNAPAITSVSFGSTNSQYVFVVFELSNVTGFDAGGSLSSSFANVNSANVNFTTTHNAELVLVGSMDVPPNSIFGVKGLSSYTASAPMSDNDNASFYYGLKSIAGSGSFSTSFTATPLRPTISVATFY